MNVSILDVKGEYGAQSASRFARYSHCITYQLVTLNDGNCRLKTPVVKGRHALDALDHTLISGVLKFEDIILPKYEILTTNLRNYLAFVTLLMTVKISGISFKRRQCFYKLNIKIALYAIRNAMLWTFIHPDITIQLYKLPWVFII